MVSVDEDVLDQSSEVLEWDLNDPALASYAPDINTEEVPESLKMAPVADGLHYVKARLANRSTGPSVYVKGKKAAGQPVDLKVVAAVDCRVLNKETGQELGFLKTWYPTSQVFKGSTGSQLTAIYFLTTGKPIPASDPKIGVTVADIRNAVEKIFVEAGEEGLTFLVQTRWNKSTPKVQEMLNDDGSSTGVFTYVYKEGTEHLDKPIKEYDEIKGQKKIIAIAALQGIPADRAHIFTDPITGEERTVQVEVVTLKDHSKYE